MVVSQSSDLLVLMMIHNDNTRIMRLIQSSGLPVERMTIEQGVWDIQVNIEIE
jgi:hypothetical protein